MRVSSYRKPDLVGFVRTLTPRLKTNKYINVVLVGGKIDVTLDGHHLKSFPRDLDILKDLMQLLTSAGWILTMNHPTAVPGTGRIP